VGLLIYISSCMITICIDNNKDEYHEIY